MIAILFTVVGDCPSGSRPCLWWAVWGWSQTKGTTDTSSTQTQVRDQGDIWCWHEEAPRLFQTKYVALQYSSVRACWHNVNVQCHRAQCIYFIMRAHWVMRAWCILVWGYNVLCCDGTMFYVSMLYCGGRILCITRLWQLYKHGVAMTLIAQKGAKCIHHINVHVTQEPAGKPTSSCLGAPHCLRREESEKLKQLFASATSPIESY